MTPARAKLLSHQAKTGFVLAAVANPAIAERTLTMRAPPFVLVAATTVFFFPACSENSDAAAPGAGTPSPDAAAGGARGGPSGTGGFVDDTSCDRTPCEGFVVGAVGYAACCIPRANACGVRVGNTCVDRTAFAPPAMGTTMGFTIPSMCVTASEPLGSYLSSGGTPTPCDYPEDAGTLPPDGG
jgi:hypothetical protein